MRSKFTAGALFLFITTLGIAGGVQPPAGANPPPADIVETRGVLRSITDEGSERVYVHLKILPGAKLPFTTLRFRVRDRALLVGLEEGASVKFRAGRVQGENTVLSIRAVPPCVRFQHCD